MRQSLGSGCGSYGSILDQPFLPAVGWLKRNAPGVFCKDTFVTITVSAHATTVPKATSVIGNHEKEPHRSQV
eukprot:5747030-Amphidinium_carterae.1